MLVETFLMLAMLSAYPVLSLVVRGWVSKLFFLLLIVSIVSLARSKAWLEKSTWDTRTTVFAMAMGSATLAILLSQMYHHDFKWTPYDEASRLLLAVPIYLAIRTGSAGVTNVLGFSFPLGAIVALVAVGWDLNVSGDERLGSYFLNVVHFGDLALMLGFLSLFSIDVGRDRSSLPTALKLCGLCAGLYLSFRSGTRGGWLAIPVLLAIWILFGSRLKPRAAIAITIGLIGLVGVAGYLMFDLIYQRIADLQSDLAAFARGNKDTSVGIRLQILQAVAHVFQENPLFGAGPQGYKDALPALARSGVITPAAVELGIAEVHNQILSYAVKYGLFGLISGLAIYFVPLVIFVQCLKSAAGNARTAGLMGICLVTGFFVFGLSVEIFNLKNTISFYSLTLAALLAVAARNSDRATAAEPRTKPVEK